MSMTLWSVLVYMNKKVFFCVKYMFLFYDVCCMSNTACGMLYMA